MYYRISIDNIYKYLNRYNALKAGYKRIPYIKNTQVFPLWNNLLL